MAILLKGKRVYEQNIAKNFYSAKEIGKEVAPLVINLWKRWNAKFIPPVIVKEKTEVEKIERLWVTAANVAHSRYKAAEKEYLESILDKLMDLTTCSHRIYLCQEEDSGCSSLINYYHILLQMNPRTLRNLLSKRPKHWLNSWIIIMLLKAV